MKTIHRIAGMIALLWAGTATAAPPQVVVVPPETDALLANPGMGGKRPSVQLGIAGRAADGWYPLSKILVRKD